MDKIAERLKAYIETHPFDSGDSDCETVLDQLYQAYLERTIEELKTEIAAFPAEHRADREPLNQLFLETLAYHTKPLSDNERIDIIIPLGRV